MSRGGEHRWVVEMRTTLPFERVPESVAAGGRPGARRRAEPFGRRPRPRDRGDPSGDHVRKVTRAAAGPCRRPARPTWLSRRPGVLLARRDARHADRAKDGAGDPQGRRPTPPLAEARAQGCWRRARRRTDDPGPGWQAGAGGRACARRRQRRLVHRRRSSWKIRARPYSTAACRRSRACTTSDSCSNTRSLRCSFAAPVETPSTSWTGSPGGWPPERLPTGLSEPYSGRWPDRAAPVWRRRR
jgi:hypothetical protein